MLPPRESTRFGECRWRYGEPVSNASVRSMCDPRDLNRHSASAVAGPEGRARSQARAHSSELNLLGPRGGLPISESGHWI